MQSGDERTLEPAWRGAMQAWTGPRMGPVVAAALVIAALAPINLAIHAALGESGLTPLWAWLSNFTHDKQDSWGPMEVALAYAGDHARGLYDQVFFAQSVKFQYAPTSLLPHSLAVALGVQPDPVTLNNLGRFIVLANVGAVGWLTWELLGKAPQLASNRRLTVLATLTAAAACLLFYPLMRGFWLGQVQVWINALFALACIAWVKNAKATTGVLLGLACLLKPQLALLALWGLLRGERRFVAAMAGLCVVALALSVAVFGFWNHVEYLEVLRFLSQRGESYFPNQSLNALLHRVFGDAAASLTFSHGQFPPFIWPVYLGTIASSAALLILALWRRPLAGGLFDLMAMALAVTLASPIAWEHHFGVMIPMLAALFVAWLAAPQGRGRTAGLVGLAAIYFCAASYFPVLAPLATTPLHPLLSLLMFAGLGAFAMLLRPPATETVAAG